MLTVIKIQTMTEDLFEVVRLELASSMISNVLFKYRY